VTHSDIDLALRIAWAILFTLAVGVLITVGLSLLVGWWALAAVPVLGVAGASFIELRIHAR
jgi:hypothetical protein